MAAAEAPTAEDAAALTRLKKSKTPVTMGTMVAVVDGLKQVLFEVAENHAAALRTAQKRIDDLEAMPMEYAGTYWPEKEYRKRQFVTFGGRVWCCVASTTRNKPGLSEDWKLAVDKGRDGKDAK